MRRGGLNLGSGPEPRRVAATFVTTEFFQLFGREPQIGRTFAPAEMHPGGPDVAVLSHGLWQTQFGGEPSIVGQTVRLDDSPFIVVGIMPPDFRFPVQADLWLPLPHPVPRWTSNTFRNYFPGFAVARLAPGVTPEQATARLDGIRRPWVDSQSARGLQVTPASELLTPLQRHLAGNRDTAFALMVLMPIQYEPQAYLSIVARGTGPDSLRALLADIRAAVTTIDPTLPVFNAQSLATAAGATIEARRINTLLISVFGVLALALAVIGVYGLLAYVVAQRTRELGIRIALGAQPAHLRHAVMRQGLALVAIGLTLGVGAAFLTTRYLESMLYGITPRDPGAFAGVLLFAAATAVACYLPARRETRVDPIVALRMET